MGTALSLVMLHTPCFHHMARDATPHLKIVYFWTKFLKKTFTIHLCFLLHGLINWTNLMNHSPTSF
ncbi:hypothetical protein KC19_VG326900 [Ceratodon purpureus]|uniref:Uncharacterized protein n=1 Tax=Ceratodon purpureus TaxID=3225 RepID=A0A8T0HWH1_CERPU|nr:hypothetical protein KC19_VG326900 [Ceratodon purpureus]